MSEATGNIGRTRVGGQILLMDGLPTFPLIGNLEFIAEGDSFPSIPFLIFTPKPASVETLGAISSFVFPSGIDDVITFLLCSL